jgi:MoaA/NifB/PqqE/SkfB family radical SAM enzyme
MVRDVSPGVVSSLRRLGLCPRDLVLYVTSACNLRCKHCYVGNALLNASESYRAPAVVAFASSFTGLRRVTVLGGEPLLHREINEIMTGLVALGIGELRVTTNLTRFFNLDIASFPPSSFLIAVSLDGHNAETHDFVRGPNAFRRTCANIVRLVESGWTIEVTHTVMRHNIDHLPEMIGLCRELRVQRLNLHLVSRMGNVLENPHLTVSPERWIAAQKTLEDARVPDGKLRIRYPPLFVSDAEYEVLCESGEYHPHAGGSYYTGGRGDRVVLYPNGGCTSRPRRSARIPA